MNEVKDQTHGAVCVDVHQFCFTRCCMWKCIGTAVVLALVFAAGYCAGMHGEGRHRSHRNFDGYRLQRSGMMMDSGDYYGGSRGNAMYYMMDPQGE